MEILARFYFDFFFFLALLVNMFAIIKQQNS